MDEDNFNDELLECANEFLEANINIKNEFVVKRHRKRLRIFINQFIYVMKNYESEYDKDKLKIILPKLIDLNIRLICCNVKGSKRHSSKLNKDIELPLLGDEVENKIRDKIVRACIKLGINGPQGRSPQMFGRWGLMMGMIRKVDTVRKIGSHNFELLKEISLKEKNSEEENPLYYTSEFIVYDMAQEHKNSITVHLGRGCLNKMENILKASKMI